MEPRRGEPAGDEFEKPVMPSEYEPKAESRDVWSITQMIEQVSSNVSRGFRG
jgi:hypothetical protein